MLIDITLKITNKMLEDAKNNKTPALEGHLGTHFDTMDKDFPLEYTKRRGIIFDVSAAKDRDIDLSDVDLSKIEANTFVAFYTGYSDKNEYGAKGYFSNSPQLSHRLIDALVDIGVSIIALDFGGIRRGSEHIPKDQFCADRGTFVIENLCNMKQLLSAEGFIANTYPLNAADISGLPCRVIAEI